MNSTSRIPFGTIQSGFVPFRSRKESRETEQQRYGRVGLRNMRYYSPRIKQARLIAAANEKDDMQDNLRNVLHEEMSKRMSQLSSDLGRAEERLRLEEKRQQQLAPYRVSSPKSGVIGKSRYAVKLRKSIIAASQDSQRPILVFGEPGLGKFNVATLIHFGSKNGKYPLITLDCSRLDEDAVELFGRGKKEGLMNIMPSQGSIILNNVHEALPEVLELLQNFLRVDKSLDDSEYEVSGGESDDSPRIIMIAERQVPGLDAQSIQVPPLRIRPSDIKPIADVYLRRLAKQRGLKSVTLTPEALRRLESGKYRNNISELEATIARALSQSIVNGNKSVVLNEEVFWFASGQQVDQFRTDLLRPLPLFRSFLRSSFWPKELNFNFTIYAYAAIVLYLYLGPQDRDHNAALNAFWCWWWPLSFIAYPFVGRVWCSICPFMITGELVQQLRLKSGAKLKKWPRDVMEKWGYLFLTSLFLGILIWEEVWDLPGHASLSSSLLMLITAGAVVGSFFFERRIWCRYLCPIGGMNGLFAKMAGTELRATQGVCSAECSTYGCYKGGPAVPPEGLESPGCPLYSHPAQLDDNRNCVLCMECLKACPHKSVQFRMRIPGADLWNSSHQPISEELALSFILLGSVALHKFPVLLNDFGMERFHEVIFNDRWMHITASIFMLGFPGIMAWAVDSAWRLAAKVTDKRQISFESGNSSAETARAIEILSRATTSYSGLEQNDLIVAPSKPFISLGYGYLPLVWSSILAYYLDLFLLEGGNILMVFGSSLGIPNEYLPAIAADPHVVEFLQCSLLTLGISSSLVLSRKIASQPWKVFLPQCVCIVGFGAEIWHLILTHSFY